MRPNGLAVLAGVVVLGFLSGAGYFFYKQPRIRAANEAAVAAAPTDAEGRLDLWLQVVAPQIHNRLITYRLSRQQPWIPTHTVRRPGSEGLDVYGIDTDQLGRELVAREGLDVVVRVPAPRLLEQDTLLLGPKASSVPTYDPDVAAPDPRERLRDLVGFFLREIDGALEKEIPEARLVVEVAPD